MSSGDTPASTAHPMPGHPMGTILRLLDKAGHLLNSYAGPAMDLLIRIWIARIFFLAGVAKIRDWENTVFLFDFEYGVPVLPPHVAAFFATAFELIMPVLLVLGLFTRFAAVPLLTMVLVIQFVLGATNPAYDQPAHYYWMILLLILIARGPGPIALDPWLMRFLNNRFGSQRLS